MRGAQSSGKRIKNGLLYVLVRMVYALASRCPSRWIAPVGRALGGLAFLVAAAERRRALKNIEAADVATTPEQRRRLVREVFARLGMSALEAVCLSRRSTSRESSLAVEIDARSAELLAAAARAGRGAVVVTAHLGNFELLAAAVAQRQGAVYVLARRSYDPRLTALLERARRACGVIPLWVEDKSHMLAALRVLRRGGFVGVLLDQPPRQGGVEASFFGRAARTSTLAAGLAKAARAALLVAFIQRRAAGGHVVRVERPSNIDACADLHDDVAVTRGLTRQLEQEIRRRPADWLWTLDRWRDEDRHARTGQMA